MSSPFPVAIHAVLALAFLAVSPAVAQSAMFGPRSHVDIPGIPYPESIAAEDFDSDGDIDLAIADYSQDRLVWLLNDGVGAYSHWLTMSGVVNPYALSSADLDGDGDMDLLSAGWAGPSWFENRGGSFLRTQLGGGGTARAICTSDVDGDGDLDVLANGRTVNSSLPHGIGWYENLGGAIFAPFSQFAFAVGVIDAIADADFDGDGDLDFITADRSDHEIAWYENLGSGAFAAKRVIINNAMGARDVFTEDLDGDGDIDALAATYLDNRIRWFENDGTGTFVSRGITSSAGFATSATARDLDGDGDLDVISSSSSDDKIAWYENLGAGTFGGQQVIDGEVWNAHQALVADLNLDGVPDVLGLRGSHSHQGQSNVFWYENLSTFDCNQNGIADRDDLAAGSSTDCNGNLVPDECDITAGTSLDCNANGIPDSCDIAAGLELDCNLNGVPDACDLLAGTSLDCNANGIPDSCDIAAGAADCNADGIPDACQIAADFTLDLNANGTLDACEAIGTTYCSPAVANSTGLPGVVTILGNETVFLNDFKVSARQLPANAFGYFIASTTPGSVFPVSNSVGTLCVIGSVGRGIGGGIVNSGPDGFFYGNVNLNAVPQPVGTVMVQPGDTWHFQAWHRDASGGQTTSNFTDAVAVTFQ